MNMKILKYTAFVLTLIGAINWGLIGLFEFNLVTFILGDMTILARFVYTFIGISAIVSAMFMHSCDKGETHSCEYGSCKI